MRHSILTPLSLVAGLAGHAAMANPACPPPSVAQGGSCVLHGDATLRDTMWLTSGTTLNCQGHRLKPMTSGTLDDPRTATNEFNSSRPELALFVRHAYDVKIQNCVISGFDFGVIVAQSKAVDAPKGTNPAPGGKDRYESMDLYTFIVEDFFIHDTRSIHNDTLQLSYSAFVDECPLWRIESRRAVIKHSDMGTKMEIPA